MQRKGGKKSAVGKRIPDRALMRIPRIGAGHTPLKRNTALTPSQEAQHITFTLQGFLKRSRLQFLIIGKILVSFRDEKRYEDLHYIDDAELRYKDMESYAEERLGLRRASLYRYMQTYAWVLANHPEWLDPKHKGYIPDFYDCVDLMWIEHELKRTDLSPALEEALKELEKKALEGKLKKGEIDPYRKRTQPDKDALKSLLMVLRRARISANKLRNMPASVIGNLDAAIDTLANIKYHR